MGGVIVLTTDTALGPISFFAPRIGMHGEQGREEAISAPC